MFVIIKYLSLLVFLVVFPFTASTQVLLDDDFSGGMDGWSYTESCSCGYELHITETDPVVGQTPPSLTWQKANICDCECLNDVFCEGGQTCFGCGACQSYEGYYSKTVQLPATITSFTLSFDWRASSNLSWSSVTNSAMHIEDENGVVIYQEDLVMGGTYDTGWQEFEETIEFEECGQWQEITIFFDVKDYWWDTPWCNKNWWDNVLLVVEQADFSTASAGSNSPVCNGEALQLSAQGGEGYTWTGPNGFNSIEQNPSIQETSESAAGTYNVVVDQPSGCDTTLFVEVEIVLNYEVNDNHNYCDGEQVILSDGTAVTADTNFVVTVSVPGACDSIINTSFAFHPAYYFEMDTVICSTAALTDFNGQLISESGNYGFPYQTEMGCDSLIELSVEVIDIPVDTVYHTICSGETVEMINGEIISSGGVFLEEIDASTPCGAILTHIVTLNASPFASFSVVPETGSIYSAETTFYNESIGYSTVLWDFNAYGTSSLENPTIDFDTEVGDYPFCLYVWNEEGCVDSLCTHYSVLEDFGYYIPNVFTPNGDGVNDLFFVVGNGIDGDRFLLEVYNRWGQIVFESDDYNEKWDGRNRSGTHYVSDGVYVYRLLIGGVNNPKRVEKIGHVTVFR